MWLLRSDSKETGVALDIADTSWEPLCFAEDTTFYYGRTTHKVAEKQNL
jgi:hypothetical protein